MQQSPSVTVAIGLHQQQIAASLKAEKLILLTDVPGVLMDKDDSNSKLSVLSIRDARKLVQNGVIGGGMIPKVGTESSTL